MAADLIAPDPGAVGRVLEAFRDADVALPVADDHLEPLHAVYGPGCLPHMRRLLAAGAHSILDLFPLVRVARVPFADTAPFFNVNTPADWAEAQRRLGVGPATRRRRSSRSGRSAAPGRPRSSASSAGRTAARRRSSSSSSRSSRAAGSASAPSSAWRASTSTCRARTRGGTARRGPTRTPWRRRPSSPSSRGATGRRAWTRSSARYFGGYDVVICEGYRREAPDVVEVFRVGRRLRFAGVRAGRGAGARHRHGARPRAPLRARRRPRRSRRFLVERLGLAARA